MREMKDSGIEWVGQIPSTWTIKPIRAEFEEVTRKNSNGEVKTALKFTYGNIVKKNNFDSDEEAYVADTILNYTVVTPGTIMLNGLNLNFDFVTQRIGLVKEIGTITSAYTAFRPFDTELSFVIFYDLKRSRKIMCQIFTILNSETKLRNDFHIITLNGQLIHIVGKITMVIPSVCRHSRIHRSHF